MRFASEAASARLQTLETRDVLQQHKRKGFPDQDKKMQEAVLEFVFATDMIIGDGGGPPLYLSSTSRSLPHIRR